MSEAARERTVLIAEDNQDMVLVLTRAFAKAGVPCKYQIVPTGVGVINYLEGHESYADRAIYPLPDLLILDLRLPFMDGFEVLRWIRGSTGQKDLPVIVLSDMDRQSNVDAAYRLGANSFFIKPLAFKEVLLLLRHILLGDPNVPEHLRRLPSDNAPEES